MTTPTTPDIEALTDGFTTAMLVTHHEDHHHARPMHLAQVEGPDTVWFVTSMDTSKVHQIRNDSSVAVTFQGKTKFASLTGTATVVVDADKIDALWKPSWDIWFPDGRDSNVALIKVQAEQGELWDVSGMHGVDFLYEAGKALWNGESIPKDAGRHEQVSFAK